MDTTVHKARTIAKHCMARIEAMGYKGKKKHEVSLDMWVAATHTAHVLGDKDLTEHMNRVGIMIIMPRGFDGLVFLNKEDN